MPQEQSLSEKVNRNCEQEECDYPDHLIPAQVMILLLQKVIDGQEELLKEVRKLTQRRPTTSTRRL